MIVKKKNLKTNNVMEIEQMQKSRVKIFTLNYISVYFYQLFTILVLLMISEIPRN